MKSIKTVSLTTLIALAAVGCTNIMGPNNTSSAAPVDTMGVNNGMVTAGGTPTSTVATTPTTAPGTTVTSNTTAVSGSLGKSMDDSDHGRVNQTLESQKTGQTTTWTNPNSNISYTMTPTRTFTSPSGQPCRDFTVSALINGQAQQVYGTACRVGNAKWQVISS